MLVSLASRPGRSDYANEDWAAASASGVAVVLDGLTEATETGCRHGTPWYVRHLGNRLLALAEEPGAGLADALAAAIEGTAAAHSGECDLTHLGSPGATVAVIRARRTAVEYLVLSDAVVVLDTGEEEPLVVTDDRVRHHLPELSAAASSEPAGPPGDAPGRLGDPGNPGDVSGASASLTGGLTGLPGGPSAGLPGGPLAGPVGGPLAGLPGGPLAGRAGGPLAGLPGGPLAGRAGGPLAGLPGGPLAGRAGGPLAGRQGGAAGGRQGGMRSGQGSGEGGPGGLVGGPGGIVGGSGGLVGGPGGLPGGPGGVGRVNEPSGAPGERAAVPSAELTALIEAHQRLRNRPEGYWVAQSDPAAAHQAISGEVPIARGGLLLSDGAALLAMDFGAMSWRELLDLGYERGPDELIAATRELERYDPNRAVWPRYKRHDDATAIVCRFDHP